MENGNKDIWLIWQVFYKSRFAPEKKGCVLPDLKLINITADWYHCTQPNTCAHLKIFVFRTENSSMWNYRIKTFKCITLSILNCQCKKNKFANTFSNSLFLFHVSLKQRYTCLYSCEYIFHAESKYDKDNLNFEKFDKFDLWLVACTQHTLKRPKG